MGNQACTTLSSLLSVGRQRGPESHGESAAMYKSQGEPTSDDCGGTLNHGLQLSEHKKFKHSEGPAFCSGSPKDLSETTILSTHTHSLSSITQPYPLI